MLRCAAIVAIVAARRVALTTTVAAFAAFATRAAVSAVALERTPVTCCAFRCVAWPGIAGTRVGSGHAGLW